MRQLKSYSLVLCLLGLAILYLPIAATLNHSLMTPDGDFSLRAFHSAIENQDMRDAFFNSLWIALCTSVGSSIIGTMAALATNQSKFKEISIFESLLLLPLIIPDIVLALSLLVWFILLKITLGQTSMVLAHITFSLSYVTMVVRARLHKFDNEIFEAARDLGASPRDVFFRVTLPMIAPGIAAGATLSFVLSFDDFLFSYFTSDPTTTTLPVRLYSMVKYGITPEMSAAAVIIIGITFLATLIVTKPFAHDYR